MIKYAVLKTLHMYDENDVTETDYPLWQKIAEYMDGEIALVIESYACDGKYVFLGLKDEEKNKELFYMMEQDSMIGVYIEDRERFDYDWENENYDPGGCLYLKPDNLQFIDQEESDRNELN